MQIRSTGRVVEVAVDAEQTQGRCIKRIWLDPEATIHPAMAQALRAFDAVVIGPGSFYTSLLPTLLVKGVAEELQAVKGPVVLVANLLTEGRGMRGFSAGEAARRVGEAIGRPVDVAVVNSGHPPGDALGRYAAEHKELLPAGDFPPGCEVLSGRFWHGPIARHERQRLAYAVWSVLARRLLA